MLQNKIYHNYIIETLKLFITILFSLAIIAWTVRAVNFLDLIVESGYPVLTYFQYSILNLIGILTKFIPLSFLIAVTIFIIRQTQENELIILWTSGVKKIHGSKLKIISPGIRSKENASNDQKRTLSAKEAVDAGADILVVGRPITNAKDPAKAAENIYLEIM